jgi:hypothetical protein
VISGLDLEVEEDSAGVVDIYNSTSNLYLVVFKVYYNVSLPRFVFFFCIYWFRIFLY